MGASLGLSRTLTTAKFTTRKSASLVLFPRQCPLHDAFYWCIDLWAEEEEVGTSTRRSKPEQLRMKAWFFPTATLQPTEQCSRQSLVQTWRSTFPFPTQLWACCSRFTYFRSALSDYFLKFFVTGCSDRKHKPRMGHSRSHRGRCRSKIRLCSLGTIATSVNPEGHLIHTSKPS